MPANEQQPAEPAVRSVEGDLTDLANALSAQLGAALPNDTRFILVLAHQSGRWSWTSSIQETPVLAILRQVLASLEARLLSGPWWEAKADGTSLTSVSPWWKGKPAKAAPTGGRGKRARRRP